MQKEIIVSNKDVRELEFIKRRLNSIEGATLEISEGRHFVRINIDFAPEWLYFVKGAVIDCLLLVKKMEFITENINLQNINVPFATLISSLLYFEHTSERSRINKLVINTRNFNIDGIYDFRMGEFKEAWRELVDITNSLIASGCTETDIYNVTTFMMSPNIKQDKALFIADVDRLLLTNLSMGGIVDIPQLFEEPQYNLIAAIISECPAEVVVESGKISEDLLKCLKNILKVKCM